MYRVKTGIQVKIASTPHRGQNQAKSLRWRGQLPVVLIMLALWACESTGGSARRDDRSSTRPASSSSGGSEREFSAMGDEMSEEMSEEMGGSLEVSEYSEAKLSSGGMVMNSLSNNPLTSKVVPRSAALSYATTVRGKASTNEATKLDGLKAARLGGADFHEVLDHAKPIMSSRIKRGKKVLPDLALLEIGLTSIQEKNIARSRIFLEPLLSSTKNSRIKAAIYNAYGVAHLQVQEYALAAQSFKKALRISPQFRAAKYNLGLLALKFGHYREAQTNLVQLQDDWYAKLALITADRQQARNSRVTSLCSQLTNQKKSHKMVLFNCGLFFLENLGQKDKARTLIEKATQQPGGDASWDEVAFQTMEKIQ